MRIVTLMENTACRHHSETEKKSAKKLPITTAVTNREGPKDVTNTSVPKSRIVSGDSPQEEVALECCTLSSVHLVQARATSYILDI